MAVGLIGKDFNVNNKIPGWESNSIGYHSDDGNIFISKTTGDKYGPTFKTGDVVGCCVDYINKIVFFTKNGDLLKNVVFEADYDLYPAVGLRKNNQTIYANFGDRNFFFDFKKYYDNVFNQLIENILKTNLNISKKSKFLAITPIDHQIILDYLNYNGYEDTFNEINNFSNKEIKINNFNSNGLNDNSNFNYFKLNNQNLKERKIIFGLLKNNKFQECLDFLYFYFPHCDYSIYLIQNISKIQYCINNFITSNTQIVFIELIKIIKNIMVMSKQCTIINNFKNNYIEKIIIKIIATSAFDLSESNNILKEILKTYLLPENIFEIVNKNILEKEFMVSNSELETIHRHTIILLKENFKVKDQTINFLFSNKYFIDKLNKKIYDKYFIIQ